MLRSDIHQLFDAAYVTVTLDYRVRVSRRLRDENDSGEPYYHLEGQEIWQPARAEERPGRSSSSGTGMRCGGVEYYQ